MASCGTKSLLVILKSSAVTRNVASARLVNLATRSMSSSGGASGSSSSSSGSSGSGSPGPLSTTVESITSSSTNTLSGHVQQHQTVVPFHSSAGIMEPSNRVADGVEESPEAILPGSKAFVECDRAAVIDLFHKHATECETTDRRFLDRNGLRAIIEAVGESADDETLERLFQTADVDPHDGVIELDVSLFESKRIRLCIPLCSYDMY